jgi:hypothetical protein
MTKLAVQKEHSHTFEYLKEGVHTLISKYTDHYSIKNMQIKWENEKANFSGKVKGVKVKGEFKISNNDVEISINIPILVAKMFQKVIENRLHRYGDELVS